MKVDVKVSPLNHINIYSWDTNDPDFFVEVLRDQLATAQAVWPELRGYSIRKRKAALPASREGGENG